MSTIHSRTALVASALTFTIAVGIAPALAQSPDPAPRLQQPGQVQPAQPAQPRASQAPAQTARGEISSVDATAKMLTIKPTEGAEQKFTYTDATKVTGARGGVAGLATMSGRQVVVHFSSQGSARVATEIEILPERSER